MADPTIQTFCCHNRIRSPPAIKLMSEFDTDGYIVVCLVSSVFGIAGAIYQPGVEGFLSSKDWNKPLLTLGTVYFVAFCQIWIRHEDGPTHHAVRRRRGGELTLSNQNLGRQIIVWLAVADLCASLGVFLRSALWKYIKDVLPPDSDVDDTTNVIFCAVSSAWIQYFYMCTWLWTLCYAINVRRQLGGARYALRTYHYYVWSISALLTGIGLTVLYVPDADCHNVHDMTTAYMRILPNYVMTYGPMIAVMVANPVIYYQASREVDRQLVARFSQMSNTERDLMTKFKLKFSLINLVFYVCWLPNLVNGIVLWTMWFNLPFSMVISVWYIMAITNPLQAFFNSLVYQKWNCRWRFRRQGSSDSSAELRRRNRTSMVCNEGTPLLQAKTESPSASTLHLHQPSVELIPTPTRSINSCSLV